MAIALQMALARPVFASPEAKVFLMTSSYGVMAGSLVGLASLSFYEHPGEHMKSIAVGASVGLYAGILMGAYMIYGVPDPSRPSRPEPDSIDLGSRHEPAASWQPYVAAMDGGALGGFLWRF